MRLLGFEPFQGPAPHMNARKFPRLLLALAVIGLGALVARSSLTSDTSHQPTSGDRGPQSKRPATAATTRNNSPAAGTPTLRIGSWNIEWLGKPGDRSGLGKGVAQSPGDLADCILGSGVAVLAVEEIVAPGPGKIIRSRELEATLASIRQKSGATWDYVLFPGRADGDQLTGVLWNTAAVTAVNAAGKPWNQNSDAPWPLPIPKARSAQGSALWNRPPHAMKFSAGQGKTDFVIIVMHMKADYNGDFAGHRAEEAAALVAALPAVRKQFSDEDLVLIGDTNCTGRAEPAIAALESAKFVDLNSAHIPTHWQGGTMDRVLAPAEQPEFTPREFTVYSDAFLKARALSPRDYKRAYSDHYLISTTIRILPDDD